MHRKRCRRQPEMAVSCKRYLNNDNHLINDFQLVAFQASALSAPRPSR